MHIEKFRVPAGRWILSPSRFRGVFFPRPPNEFYQRFPAPFGMGPRGERGFPAPLQYLYLPFVPFIFQYYAINIFSTVHFLLFDIQDLDFLTFIQDKVTGTVTNLSPYCQFSQEDQKVF